VTGGILTDDAIRDALDHGGISIDPFDESQMNPASYDLRLGEGVAVYDKWVSSVVEQQYPRCGWHLVPLTSPSYPATTDDVLDAREEPLVTRFQISESGWILKPGIGYLMHTLERVCTTKFVPVLDGKSSIGRLFVQVHATAGYGDPGFDGQYTLEVTVAHPIRLYAGMRIAQIRFHTIHGTLRRPYDGNYTGASAHGAVPSRAWRQFK